LHSRVPDFIWCADRFCERTASIYHPKLKEGVGLAETGRKVRRLQEVAALAGFFGAVKGRRRGGKFGASRVDRGGAMG
jgi:hypothetical protein